MAASPIDFLHKPTAPTLGWLLLFAGTVALGTAIWLDQQWSEGRANEQRLVSELAKRDPVAIPPPLVPPPVALRAAQAQEELSRPLMPVLSAVEAATQEPVYLLSLSIDANGATVRLEAEAPSAEAAMDFAKSLGDDGVLQPGFLLSHSPAQNPTLNGLIRFSVTTQRVTR